MIRVDQAGEFGAVRIYEGQLAALRWTGRTSSDTGRKIAAMARAEREHRATFDKMLAERRVRPTALSPLWSLAGFGLGVATALMGDKAAMACTVAVEETIDEHYAEPGRRSSATTRRSCAPPSRSSAPTRSPTRTRRSPPAPSRRPPTRR